MAVLSNIASGNFTASSTWAVVENSTWTQTIAVQETGVTALTTSFQRSAIFTVPSTQTLQGLLLKVSARQTTPGCSVTARIFDVTGNAVVANTTVTIDALDMPNGIGWVYFKFPANATLNTATNYGIDLLSTIGSGATFHRKTATAANWTFGLVTTTNASPLATDQLLIQGENTLTNTFQTFTVTCDNTLASIFGPNVAGAAAIEISGKGIFSFSTAASQNYLLNLDGNLLVNLDGIFRAGTSVAPIPSTSTVTITFDVASNVQYGLIHRAGGIIQTYGATKTTKTTLASNVGSGGTTITTNDSTGWSTGDTLAIASTVRAQIGFAETVTLTGPAVGTSIPITAAVNFHDGNASAILPRANVINLTRNIRIKGISASLQTYVVTGVSGTVSFNFTEFQYLGSATANLRGIDNLMTSGTFELIGCSFENFEVASSVAINFTSTSNIGNIQNCVFYRIIGASILTLTTGYLQNPVVINDCVSIGGSAMNTLQAMSIYADNGTYTNLVAANSSTSGIYFVTNTVLPSLTINNLTSYVCTGANMQLFPASESNVLPATITNILSYRSTAEGLAVGSSSVTAALNFNIDGGRLFGNTTRGLTLGFVFSGFIKNMNIYNEVGYDQPNGIVMNNHIENVYFDNCNIGVSVAHSVSDVRDVCPRNEHVLFFRNCNFGSTTEFSNQSLYTVGSYVGSAKHDQTAGNHRMYKKFGTITSDSTFFKTASPSQRLTPSDASNKLFSQEKRVAIPSGNGASVSVWVRKSVIGDGSAYNGNEVQLRLLADPALGIASDTIIATTTVFGNGTFELITGTIPTLTDNGVARLVISCDGTSGWVNVDLWAVTIV